MEVKKSELVPILIKRLKDEFYHPVIFLVIYELNPNLGKKIFGNYFVNCDDELRDELIELVCDNIVIDLEKFQDLFHKIMIRVWKRIEKNNEKASKQKSKKNGLN